MVIKEVLDMKYFVNTSAIILRSADFAFTMNPNGPMKDRYIGIFSKIIYWPASGIFSANQVHANGHLYDYKPHKIVG